MGFVRQLVHSDRQLLLEAPAREADALFCLHELLCSTLCAAARNGWLMRWFLKTRGQQKTCITCQDCMPLLFVAACLTEHGTQQTGLVATQPRYAWARAAGSHRKPASAI